MEVGNIVYGPLDSAQEQSYQIDHTGAEWMHGMGPDGVPFDTILTQLSLFNAPDESGAPFTDISQVVFELMSQHPSKLGLGATVQHPAKISRSLNRYLRAVGPSVFMDGSLKTV